MKTFIYIMLFIACFPEAAAQVDPVTGELEEQSEIIAGREGGDEEDSYMQQLANLKEHPVNINLADEDDLKAILLLTPLQIDQLLQYRKLLGPLLSIYELQALPAWDLTTIRKVQYFISITDVQSMKAGLKERLTAGQGSLITRFAFMPEKTKEYQPAAAGSKYKGGRDRWYFRYRYAYKNTLEWGVLGDKDAGEQFLKGKQSYGFDFYSFHFFLRKMRMIKALALGDYTVNMGQGLIQWQGAAFVKGSDAISIKRQSASLRPYNSAGEFNFYRGAAISMQKGNWEWTGFLSYRKLDGSGDSLAGNSAISALISSGYHRTEAEAAKKGNLKQLAAGGVLQYKLNAGAIGFNLVHHRLSKTLQKKDEPYNLFALKGDRFTNASLDYSYTYRNMHFFGEAAINENKKTAILQGALISLSSGVSLSFLYRQADRKYQALYANAFTENNYAGNETGFYMGTFLQLSHGVSITAYTDIFSFPWLKYRTDAPSHGRESMLQVTYKPDKKTELYFRYKYKAKGLNYEEEDETMHYVKAIPRQSLRLQYQVELSPSFSFRNRAEIIWYDKGGRLTEQGFALLADLLFKSSACPWSGNIRLACFNTEGYNSRVYAYEADVLYHQSILPMYTKGSRYFLNLHRKIISLARYKTGIYIYLRFSQTIHSQLDNLRLSIDEVSPGKQSDIKVQFVIK